MSEAADLYETDFSRWAEQQAKALREAGEAGHNLPLDWQNLAEEVDALARADRLELLSRLETIIEHLLKLEYSATQAPASGWRNTVRRSRNKISDLLDESPSLRRDLAASIRKAAPRALEAALDSLNDHEASGPVVAAKLGRVSYGEEQILGDWFPERSTDDPVA